MNNHNKTNLSVNLNKVALLRNQRDVGYPSVIKAAEIALNAGAAGITVHPRPDERHIRKSDIPELADFIQDWPDKNIEFNIEGYPSDDFIDLVLTNPCHQVTLVPDAPNQNTSDHGWDAHKHHDMLKEVTKTLQENNRRVSLFLDPVPTLIEHVISIGAKRIELYTGPYAENKIALEAYAQTAQKAFDNNIEVNAGHDLNLDNLTEFIRAIPYCAEVSIGHAITADALLMGWDKAIKSYLSQITKAYE